MFEQAPSFMALLRGPLHVFEMANAAYLRATGERDLIGKEIREAMPELAGQGIFELLDKVYGSGEPFVAHGMPVRLKRAPHAELEEIIVNFVYQPIFEPEGNVSGIFVEGHDVTEQYRTQQELARNIERLREVEQRQRFQIEVSDHLRSITNPADVPAAACELLGQHLGLSHARYVELHDTLGTCTITSSWSSPGAADLSPQERDQFEAQRIGALREGKIIVTDSGQHAGIASQESALLLPIMKARQLIAYFSLYRAGRQPWSADALDAAKIFTELTWATVEAARAHALLKRERDQSQHIFDSMSEGFAIISSDWRMLQINAVGLKVGRRVGETVVGRSLWEVWPETVGTDVESTYRHVMATREPSIFETHVNFSGSEWAWLEIRLLPVLGGGMAVFYRDITERKQLIDQLKATDTRKDEFLAMLAHELRTPLAPISAAADLLRAPGLSAERVSKTSEVISRQVRHMTRLIDDLMDVSRVTSGLVTLQLQMLDVKQTATDAIEQVRPLIEARRHRLRIDLPKNAVFVSGDPKRLVQVLANILNNAAKYTPEEGEIALHVQAEEDSVSFIVTDTGIGMAPDLIQRAFDLFSQAERTSDRSQGGLGLGLALVHSLIELHKGSVLIRSEGMDRGTEVTVRLKREQPGKIQARTPNPHTLLPKGSGLRILVVDDNEDGAQMLKILLETMGYTVAVEYSSAGAIERCMQSVFDVFLLDIGLPEMDGKALARKLRTLPLSSGAVFIAITGYGQEQDRIEIFQAGYVQHFVKPVNIDKLAAVLANIAK